MSDAAFVARFSRWRRMAGIAGCLGFVALGLWIAGVIGGIDDPSPPIGWLSVVTFGTFALFGLVTIARSGDALRVDQHGIWKWDRRGGRTIAWDDIAAINEVRVRGQRYLAVDLRREEPTLPRGRMEGLFGDVSLGTQATDRCFAELEEAVKRFSGWQG